MSYSICRCGNRPSLGFARRPGPLPEQESCRVVWQPGASVFRLRPPVSTRFRPMITLEIANGRGLRFHPASLRTGHGHHAVIRIPADPSRV